MTRWLMINLKTGVTIRVVPSLYRIYRHLGFYPIADPRRLEAQNKRPDNSLNKGASK